MLVLLLVLLLLLSQQCTEMAIECSQLTLYMCAVFVSVWPAPL